MQTNHISDNELAFFLDYLSGPNAIDSALTTNQPSGGGLQWTGMVSTSDNIGILTHPWGKHTGNMTDAVTGGTTVGLTGDLSSDLIGPFPLWINNSAGNSTISNTNHTLPLDRNNMSSNCKHISSPEALVHG